MLFLLGEMLCTYSSDKRNCLTPLLPWAMSSYEFWLTILSTIFICDKQVHLKTIGSGTDIPHACGFLNHGKVITL